MTKEEKIIAIAEDEFYHHGFLGTSMVNVAMRAGVTHAMVNYYFRSKEQLFLKILDSHTFAFCSNLENLMSEGDDFVQTAVLAANCLFDTFNEDRMLPFLILDVSRGAPDLLYRYKVPVVDFLNDAFGKHSQRLEVQMKERKIAETSMSEILENLLLLVASSFLLIPTLENLSGLSKKRIDNHLARRKKEIETIIRTRYSVIR